MDSGGGPGRCQINSDYTMSVELAGGVPYPIPFTLSLGLIPALLDVIDGVLFTGGDDLDPGLYGEDWHPKAFKIEPRRQEFELALLAEAEKRGMPVMGICLGCQVLNVYRGGSLHQFLPDLPRENAIEHRRLERDLPLHDVRIEADSTIGRAIGSQCIRANTYHKQAIKRLGRGLRAVAWAPDGVIEAVEDASFPLLAAVQWHPERMKEHPEHLAVFKLLVEKARNASCRNAHSAEATA